MPRPAPAISSVPQILRGFGMAFCFVPLSVTAMARMSQARMGQASGLFNLTRQIGGSVGVAWLASRLSALRAQHVADLTADLDIFNPDVRAALQGTSGAMGGRGVSMDQARDMALAVPRLPRAAGAAELAFRDMFRHDRDPVRAQRADAAVPAAGREDESGARRSDGARRVAPTGQPRSREGPPPRRSGSGASPRMLET